MKDDKPLVLSGKMIEIPIGKPAEDGPKKPVVGSHEWVEAAGRLARRYAPPMHPCRDCGWPQIEGLRMGHLECDDC